MNHSIKKMLRLIDPNLTILEITQEKIKHQMTLVIKADLSLNLHLVNVVVLM